MAILVSYYHTKQPKNILVEYVLPERLLRRPVGCFTLIVESKTNTRSLRVLSPVYFVYDRFNETTIVRNCSRRTFFFRIQREERDNKKQNVRLTLSNSPIGGQSPKRPTAKFLSPSRYVCIIHTVCSYNRLRTRSVRCNAPAVHRRR